MLPVGYSSEVYKYTSLKPKPPKSLPIITRLIWSVARSEFSMSNPPPIQHIAEIVCEATSEFRLP